MGEIDFGDGFLDDLCAESYSLLLEEIHHVWTHDAIREARIVFDIGCDHELTAWFWASKNNGIEVGSSGVESGGVSGGNGSNDCDFVAHDLFNEVTCGFVRGGKRGSHK